MNNALKEGPLAGIRVVEVGQYGSAPLAAMLLGDFGADVIKVEPPQGDLYRGMPPIKDGESFYFAGVNRNKRGIVLDLKTEEGQAALRAVLVKTDVLIENLRPGVMARLGLGYDDLRKINPGLIYCSISGYGQDGPRALEAGHDLNYIGATGLLDLQPGAPDRPVVPPMLAADIAGGSFPAVINILLALRARDQSGEGCHIDIAMTDAMFTFGWYALAIGAATGRFPAPGELRLVGSSPRYRLYPTRDGKLVACGALEQKFWEAFTAAIGLPADLADDARSPSTTLGAVAERIAQRTADDWRPILTAAECCATIVTPLEEAMRDPHFVARGLFAHEVEMSEGSVLPALPVPIAPAFRGRPGTKRAP